MLATGAFAAAAGEPVARSWVADNGNGTYSNPLFYEEFEDPDVIRVGEDSFSECVYPPRVQCWELC